VKRHSLLVEDLARNVNREKQKKYFKKTISILTRRITNSNNSLRGLV
jgi:hypothetical protein